MRVAEDDGAVGRGDAEAALERDAVGGGEADEPGVAGEAEGQRARPAYASTRWSFSA